MKRVTGVIVLGLSACGYPLTQLVVRRWGVRGAAVAECVCAGLVIRDASMVAGGAPGRLRRVPAALLFLELGAGVVASLAGLPPLLSAQPADRAGSARRCAADNVRRAAVAVLFAIHTVRFAIYLRPDQGQAPRAGLTARLIPAWHRTGDPAEARIRSALSHLAGHAAERARHTGW